MAEAEWSVQVTPTEQYELTAEFDWYAYRVKIMWWTHKDYWKPEYDAVARDIVKNWPAQPVSYPQMPLLYIEYKPRG